VWSLDVSGELTLRDLKALLEVEIGLEASEMLLVHNMAPMTEDMKMLEDYDVRDGDIIMVSQHFGTVTLSNPPTPDSQASSDFPLPSHNQQSSQLPSQPHPLAHGGSPSGRGTATAGGGSGSFPAIDWSSVHLPGLSSSGTANPPGAANPPGTASPPGQRGPDDPDSVRQYFLSNPYELAMLQQRNPPLAEALLSGDPQRFRDALRRHQMAVREMERQRIRMINADPFDPEYQAKIAQDIQQKNIDENMEAALEYTPESFSRVVMLYINCRVNGVPVKALVDSGARSTVMSAACAERCNIMRLVDRRFAGVAFGVGTQKIIGRVHLGQIQIGNDFLASSFQVLENQSEDMLLGLDMLRRHLVSMLVLPCRWISWHFLPWELEGITSLCCLLIGQYPHHMTLCPPVTIVKRCYGIHYFLLKGFSQLYGSVLVR